MVIPQVTYEGPAYAHGLVVQLRERPISVERLRNGLWRVHYGSGLVRTYDRDPRPALSPKIASRPWPRSLNEAAHKVAA